MKPNRIIIAILAAVLVAWLFIPPATDVNAQPIGSEVISDIKAIDEVFKTAATHDVVAGTAGQRIRILSLSVRSLSSTANNIYFSEEGVADTVLGTNSTDVETLDQLGISGKAGWMFDGGARVYQTSTTGTDFEITLSGATAVAVVGTYVEVR